MGTALNLGLVMAQVVYGLTANSMALLADAAHNFGDVLALLLAWGAAWMGQRLESPKPTTFLIGGAIGIDPALVDEADERMSLGPLTLPHQLARVVLGEQVYRALADLAGHPYPHAGGGR